jgi:hypothetical protein
MDPGLADSLSEIGRKHPAPLVLRQQMPLGFDLQRGIKGKQKNVSWDHSYLFPFSIFNAFALIFQLTPQTALPSF